jgi:hypothetical protein
LKHGAKQLNTDENKDLEKQVSFQNVLIPHVRIPQIEIAAGFDWKLSPKFQGKGFLFGGFLFCQSFDAPGHGNHTPVTGMSASI